MKKILITGAAGTLGSALRNNLKDDDLLLRISDIAPLAAARAHEEIMPGNLGDIGDVMRIVQGVDGIVHLGGISSEARFEDLLNANIRGTYHVFEAARRNGCNRILFASSNHVIGFYPRDVKLDCDSPPRPDSLYGVSKAYGENLARYYFDKFGIESVSVRIGSCWPAPKDRRMMHTWMGFADFASLVRAVFAAPSVGAAVMYGVSDNRGVWWDNSAVDFLGWAPRESSEPFRSMTEAAHPPEDPQSVAGRYQGGPFCAAGHVEDIQEKKRHEG